MTQRDSHRVPVYLHALGMVNALGHDADAVRHAVIAAKADDSSGMGAIATAQGQVYVGAVTTPLDHAPSSELARFDCRHNRLLLAALAQIAPAIDAARADFGADRIGVVLGTSASGIREAEVALAQRARTGEFPAAFDYRQMEIGMAGPFAAAALQVGGPAFTVSTACTSSAKAFTSARRLLQLNLCDAVVVGGVDALCEMTMQGFASLESISPVRSNPMSVNRRGINIGEGAAVFVMRRDEAAVFMAGAGESSDAHHISSPDPLGVGSEIALRAALADAGIGAAAIHYVNLHATATRKNDEMEAHLMARVFPEGVATSGTKPMTGHLLGAAGATELGLAWLALSYPDAPLPRHLWDGQADSAVPVLDLIEGARFLPRHGGTHYVMSNSFAFGGSNASIVLGRGSAS
jgi:3-oxoacyl-[acyl-carrier-protein] synthase-1